MDDAYVRDSQLSPQDDTPVENSYARAEPTTPLEEHIPNEEERNRKQHEPKIYHHDILKEANPNQKDK